MNFLLYSVLLSAAIDRLGVTRHEETHLSQIKRNGHTIVLARLVQRRTLPPVARSVHDVRDGVPFFQVRIVGIAYATLGRSRSWTARRPQKKQLRSKIKHLVSVESRQERGVEKWVAPLRVLQATVLFSAVLAAGRIHRNGRTHGHVEKGRPHPGCFLKTVVQIAG